MASEAIEKAIDDFANADMQSMGTGIIIPRYHTTPPKLKKDNSYNANVSNRLWVRDRN